MLITYHAIDYSKTLNITNLNYMADSLVFDIIKLHISYIYGNKIYTFSIEQHLTVFIKMRPKDTRLIY